jgi:molybdopterin/thiamine biosynthesis adenylyltransferase
MATLTATPATAQLSKDEILRYSRHLIMPEVGMEGQRKLKAAKVLCIGAGGLGSRLALYLAAAGIGKLGIVDFDVVDYTNLQRQVIHDTNHVGRPKLASAKETIHDINPFVEVVTYETRLTSENALDLFREYDIVADGTDNFPTRYLVNDACVLLGKPTTFMAASFASRGRRRSSTPRRVRAIAASILSRLRPAWRRVARKAECWECCRASSAAFRRCRPSS